MSEITQKPWGAYIDHFRTPDCVFKTLVIQSGQSLSYQVHEDRSEVWFISEGVATIKTSMHGDETALTDYMMSQLNKGDYIFIQRGTAHQIANNGDNELHIHEMQFGNCSEEDITRLQDPHNRQ